MAALKPRREFQINQVAVEGALVEAFAAAGAWFGGAPHTVVGTATELALARSPSLFGFCCLARGFHCAAGLDLAARVRGRSAPCLQVQAALEMVPCEGPAVAVRQALELLVTATSADNGESLAATGFGQCLDRNNHEAAKWYERAADQKHTATKFNMGLAKDIGRRMTQSDWGSDVT
jgi:hypothetical protein